MGVVFRSMYGEERGRMRDSFSAMAIRSLHALEFPAGDFIDVSHEMKLSILDENGWRTASVRAVAPPKETPITQCAFGTRRALRSVVTSEARTSTVTRAPSPFVVVEMPDLENRPRML